MSACAACGKDVEPVNWASTRIVTTETGRYFQGPKRTWLFESPGVKAYMVDDDLYCQACFEKN